jgi:putative endonuclease
MIWNLYIVICKDKSLYTGITIDINRRIKEHNNGKGAKSLLGKLPVKLVYTEEFNNQSDAMKREREIKSWKREKKLKLISGL